jgi:hypothetical protein
MFIPPPPSLADDAGAVQDTGAAYAFAAKLLEEGTPPAEVRRRLLELGLDEKTASTFLTDLIQAREGVRAEFVGHGRAGGSLTECEAQALREAGNKNMLYGALWFFGGLIVTLLTFTAAQGGGRYVIAWGAVVFGAIQFMRGYSQASGALPAGPPQEKNPDSAKAAKQLSAKRKAVPAFFSTPTGTSIRCRCLARRSPCVSGVSGGVACWP